MPTTQARPFLPTDTSNAPLIPDAEVRELYAGFEETTHGVGPYADVATMLDDWFRTHGWPGVLDR